MRTKILSVVLLLATCSGVWADDAAKVDTFKCYLETTLGKGIYNFSWNVADTYKQIYNIPGTSLVAPELPGARVVAKKVHECVQQNKQFVSSKARELDKQRPQ